MIETEAKYNQTKPQSKAKSKPKNRFIHIAEVGGNRCGATSKSYRCAPGGKWTVASAAADWFNEMRAAGKSLKVGSEMLISIEIIER